MSSCVEFKRRYSCVTIIRTVYKPLPSVTGGLTATRVLFDLFSHVYPKGGRGCLPPPLPPSPPVWNLRAFIWFPLCHFLSCFFSLVLVLFLYCNFSANGPFSNDFSPQFFLQPFSLRVRIICMTFVQRCCLAFLLCFSFFFFSLSSSSSVHSFYYYFSFL